MSTLVLFCESCRAEREFEQPLCSDDHDGECPDLACVECGLAVFAFVDADAARPGRRTARRSHRVA